MARWSIALVCLVLGGVAGTLVTDRVLQGQAPSPPAIPKELYSYRDVVKHVLPAVVSVEARAKVQPRKASQPSPRRRARPGDFPGLPDEFRRFFDDMEQAPLETPHDSPAMGFGSGVIVDPKGVILTNNHVVDGAGMVEVELKDGRKFTSKDIVTDKKTDLAIIRLDGVKGSLPYLQFGDSDAMEIGDRVLAVGAPFGLTGTVTEGIISAKGRNGLRMNMYEDFLQTDAAINPGNSGGPLVNLEGKIIGINSAIKSRSGGFQGVGLAIASNLAQNVMHQLQKDGRVHRGYLGVQIRELDPEVAKRLGVNPEQGGVLVSQTFENAPAAKGGVQSGDVIVSVSGKPIKDGRELQRLVATLPLGKPVDVTVLRDGKTKVLQVTVEEQPDDFGTARAPVPQQPRGSSEVLSQNKIGLDLSDLTPELADQFGLREGATGVLIHDVHSNSPAALAGLRRGMLLVKVDKKPVHSAVEAKEALDKGALDKGVLLQVYSAQGGTNFVVVRVEGEGRGSGSF